MKTHARTLFFAMLLAAVSTAPARATLLSDLISLNGSVFSGGLVFDEFEYLASGDMPDPSLINVVAYFDGTDHGIKIQGPFVDLPGGGFSDGLIEFRVSAVDENCLITSATLAGNPAVIGGNGFITVTETFQPENFDEQLTIFAISPGAIDQFDATQFGPGYKSIHVQKDILAGSAGDLGGLPTLSFLTQTFHCVPEPASVTLFGLGLAGVASLQVRRRWTALARRAPKR